MEQKRLLGEYLVKYFVNRLRPGLNFSFELHVGSLCHSDYDGHDYGLIIKSTGGCVVVETLLAESRLLSHTEMCPEHRAIIIPHRS